jgi:CheY-like chemotaxis protein
MWTIEQPVRRPAYPPILVVEDEILVRVCAAQCLADAGFQVIEAGDAGEALAVLAEDREIGLVFTDVNMPGSLDGFDLAWEARRRRPRLPLIVTSGRSPARWRRLPAGGLFLAKPYRPEALPAILSHVLANASMRLRLMGKRDAA